MNTRRLRYAWALAGLLAAPVATIRAADADSDCTLKFSLTEWSVIYKRAEGAGDVTCKNGESMHVKISAVGVGVTIGKFHIDDGNGKFASLQAIGDVPGSYLAGGANIGAVKAGSVQLLTKGSVSLTLMGRGRGANIGVNLSNFTITEAK